MPLPTVRFKHARFTARFPEGYLYSRSHYWMAPVEGEEGLWRAGFTKFATRMLGELVDQSFDKPVGAAIKPGEILGWIEGFKAISDIYGVIDGTFQGGNPALKADLAQIHDDPYEAGWLYAAAGTPDANCVPATEYAAWLNATIDRMLEQQKDSPSPPDA